MTSLRRPACRFYLTSSGCRFGDSCWYSHASEDRRFVSIEPCRYYWNGGCWRGNDCTFSHTEPKHEKQDTTPRSDIENRITSAEKQDTTPLSDIGNRITSVMNALKSIKTPDLKPSDVFEKPTSTDIDSCAKIDMPSGAIEGKTRKKKNGRARKKERQLKEKEEEIKREELRQRVSIELHGMKSVKCGLCKAVFKKIKCGDLCNQLIRHYVEMFKEHDKVHLNYFDKDIFFEPEDPKIKRKKKGKKKKRGNAPYSVNHLLEDIVDAKVNEPIVSCMCANCFYHGASVKDLMKHRVECMTAGRRKLEEKHRRRHSRVVNRVARLFAWMDLMDSLQQEKIFSKDEQAKYRRRFDIELCLECDIFEGVEDHEHSDALRDGLESLFKKITVGEKNGNDRDDESTDGEGSDIDSDHEFHPAMIPAYVREHQYGHRFGSDDDSDDYGMFGFDEDDCFELMCQGIKPWDACAGRALSVIYGGHDF